MEKLEKARRAGTMTQARRVRAAMPAIIRNIPPGHSWGWYSREDPRMHLQLLGKGYVYKTWLEEKGKRVFVPDGKIPAKILKSLGKEVEVNRRPIEDLWVRFMLDNGWLGLHVALPQVTLVAYPNTPNKFVRKIDVAKWFTREQLATLGQENITLDREMAAIRFWSDRSEEQVPYDVRISSLLWVDG